MLNRNISRLDSLQRALMQNAGTVDVAKVGGTAQLIKINPSTVDRSGMIMDGLDALTSQNKALLMRPATTMSQPMSGSAAATAPVNTTDFTNTAAGGAWTQDDLRLYLHGQLPNTSLYNMPDPPPMNYVRPEAIEGLYNSFMNKDGVFDVGSFTKMVQAFDGTHAMYAGNPPNGIVDRYEALIIARQIGNFYQDLNRAPNGYRQRAVEMVAERNDPELNAWVDGQSGLNSAGLNQRYPLEIVAGVARDTDTAGIEIVNDKPRLVVPFSKASGYYYTGEEQARMIANAMPTLMAIDKASGTGFMDNETTASLNKIYNHIDIGEAVAADSPLTQAERDAVLNGLHEIHSQTYWARKASYTDEGRIIPGAPNDVQLVQQALQSAAAKAEAIGAGDPKKAADIFMTYMDAVLMGGQFPKSFIGVNPPGFENRPVYLSDTGWDARIQDHTGTQTFHTMSYAKLAYLYGYDASVGAAFKHEFENNRDPEQGSSRQDYLAGFVGARVGKMLSDYRGGNGGMSPTQIANNIGQWLGNVDTILNDDDWMTYNLSNAFFPDARPAPADGQYPYNPMENFPPPIISGETYQSYADPDPN